MWLNERAPWTTIPPLLGLHAYEAAARHLSFAAAAAEMHLSASAVSQRVRSLEAHLGMRLFERLPRSLRLTEMGEAYLPAVRDIFEDLSAATSGLFGGSEQASLTVRVQIAYAATWLAPRLPEFCASFPHIDLKLVSAIWADALPPFEIDLEIRQGNGSWPGFVSTKLHDDTAVAIYGPQFLTLHGPANHISDLVSHGRVHVPASTTCGGGSFPPTTCSVLRHRASSPWTLRSQHWRSLPAATTGRSCPNVSSGAPSALGTYSWRRTRRCRCAKITICSAGTMPASSVAKRPRSYGGCARRTCSTLRHRFCRRSPTTPSDETGTLTLRTLLDGTPGCGPPAMRVRVGCCWSSWRRTRPGSGR